LLIALLGAPALAQSPAAPSTATPSNPEEEPGDFLKNMWFIRPSFAAIAFLTPDVGIVEGLARFTTKRYPVGILGEREIDYFGFQQTIEGAFRFAPWIGASIQMKGEALFGLNTTSLVLRSGSMDVSAEASVGVKVLRSESSGTLLTARGFAGVNSGNQLTLLPLLQAIVDRPGETLAAILDSGIRKALVVPSHEKLLGGGVYLAQILPWGFGLQASMRMDYNWRTEQPADIVSNTRVDQDSHYFRFIPALALLYDFGPGFPLALLGEYQFTLGTRSGTTFLNGSIQSHIVSLGVYYSGQHHLQLGLTGAALLRGEPLIGFNSQSQQENSDYVRAKYLELTLRYVW
jgi:hypothetical protein